MHILGLIGGIASGKSAVAAALARRGAVVFNADQLGHEVLKEPAVRDALVARWGAGVLNADKEVDRSAVARIVFAPGPAAAEELDFLESLVHPGIRRRIEAGIRQLPDASVPAVVIDAALLVEAGWAAVCTAMAFVDAPRDQRIARAAARGWTEQEFSLRETAQLPIEEKRRRASHQIANSGSLADLEAEVERFWQALGAK